MPQQALYLLNNPFVLEQARAAAAREEIARSTTNAARVDHLYRAVLGRAPTAAEAELAMTFLELPSGKAGLSPLEQLAQVLLISNEFLFVD